MNSVLPEKSYNALIATIASIYDQGRLRAMQAVNVLLSWSHYVELLKIDNALERGFYEKQATHERWSVPELKRQKDSALFLRLAASTDKE